MAISYNLNISDRLSVLQTATLKDGTDVTQYITGVVCSLSASEGSYSSFTDAWVSLTPPADHTGPYVPFSDLTTQPDFVSNSANSWASDDLKAGLASQIEAQKTAPKDETAPWA